MTILEVLEDITIKYLSSYFSRTSYLIIKYSGSNSYGTIKARGSFSTLIQKISVGSNTDTTLKKYDEIYNYFYASVGYPSYNYLYFYFDDPYTNLKDPIYICKTNNDPETYSSTIRDCYFSSLYYDEKNPTSNYDYSYKVDISSYHGGYVIVKYSFRSSYDSLYVKALYKSNKLSTVAIVFIAIAGVVFVTIIIAILCYSCKRRAANNIAYVPTQPPTIVSEQPALVVQTPSYPLVQ